MINSGRYTKCVLFQVRNNVDVLSKSVKPIISILCRIVGNDMTMCHKLAQDENLLLNVCRGKQLLHRV